MAEVVSIRLDGNDSGTTPAVGSLRTASATGTKITVSAPLAPNGAALSLGTLQASGGTVGIGFTSPAAKLGVDG